jgi:hypothetical protein
MTRRKIEIIGNIILTFCLFVSVVFAVISFLSSFGAGQTDREGAIKASIGGLITMTILLQNGDTHHINPIST